MEQVGVPGTAGWSNRETGNTKRQEGRLKRSALHGRLKSGPLAAASGPYEDRRNPRGARLIVPLLGGSVVDVGFGFELGEHGLEERFVGVGSAGDSQLHFLGGNGVIAAMRGEASLRQVA
jgi:hypothetical protein